MIKETNFFFSFASLIFNNASFPINCFFENGLNSKKREWVKITYNYFKKNNYKMGLNKCLNKIDLLIV